MHDNWRIRGADGAEKSLHVLCSCFDVSFPIPFINCTALIHTFLNSDCSLPLKRYYRNWARNNIATFDDEDDSERIVQLLRKGEEHRLWILKKYKLQDPLASK